MAVVTKPLPFLSTMSFHPIRFLRTWYRNLTERTEFKMKYDNRNQPQAIKPFLDSLDCKYQIILPDFVLVESSTQTMTKLDKLLFKPLLKQEGVNTPYFMKLDKMTKGLFTDIRYQPEYNFEVYIVQSTDWASIQTTLNILDKLHTDNQHYFNHFMAIYRELATTRTTL